MQNLKSVIYYLYLPFTVYAMFLYFSDKWLSKPSC